MTLKQLFARSQVRSNMHISDIHIYPIKGCRGYSLENVEITPMGLRGDREFTLMQEGGWVNQKLNPNLYQLGAVWQGSDLVLTFPHQPDFVLATEFVGTESPLTIYGQAVPVLDMGDAVAHWLGLVLGQPVRLVRAKAPVDWYLPLQDFTKVHGQKQNKFVDTSPVLLTSQASLDDLNQRLKTPVTMDRFRANLVVTGLQAYAEDERRQFEFPQVTLDQVAPCERCTVVTVDQSSGIRAKEPLLTLSGYRRRPDGYAGGIVFGAYLMPLVAGRVAVGDESS